MQLEVFRAIYAKDGSLDIVFLLQFFEKYIGESGCRGRKIRRQRISFVFGFAVAYSQNCGSLIRITVSSTAT